MIAIFRNDDGFNKIRRIVEFDVNDPELRKHFIGLKEHGINMQYDTVLEFFDGTIEKYNEENNNN